VPNQKLEVTLLSANNALRVNSSWESGR